MKIQNGPYLKKIIFWYFDGYETVPKIVFHTIIDNDASLTKIHNPCLVRKQYLSDMKQNIINQSV